MTQKIPSSFFEKGRQYQVVTETPDTEPIEGMYYLMQKNSSDENFVYLYSMDNGINVIPLGHIREVDIIL